MARLDKSWMDIPNRLDVRYCNGCREFLQWAFHDDNIRFRHGKDKEFIQCPCKKCHNTVLLTKDDAMIHLICHGMWLRYRRWFSHGEEQEMQQSMMRNMVEFETQNIHDVELHSERQVDSIMDMLDDLQEGTTIDAQREDEPNAEAQKFYKMLIDAETPIYAECSDMPKLQFLFRLLHIKCVNRVTNRCMNMFLKLFKDVLPSDAFVPEVGMRSRKSSKS